MGGIIIVSVAVEFEIGNALRLRLGEDDILDVRSVSHTLLSGEIDDLFFCLTVSSADFFAEPVAHLIEFSTEQTQFLSICRHGSHRRSVGENFPELIGSRLCFGVKVFPVCLVFASK